MGPPLAADLLPEPGQPLPLLRPLEIGELLDEAFELYRRNFRLFFGIAILLDLPATLLQIAYASPTSGLSWADGLALALLPVTFCALTTASLERILGRETTIVVAYRKTARRAGRLLIGTLVYLLTLAVPVAVLILPGALLVRSQPVLAAFLLTMGLLLLTAPLTLLSLWGILLIPVIVAENRGAGALPRCRRLPAGNMWRLFFLSMGLTLVVIISFFVFLGLRGLAQALTGVDTWMPPDRSNPTELLLHAGITLTESFVVDALLPITIIASVLAYLDMRIRQEALDLELLTAGVERDVAVRRGAPAATSPGAPSPTP
jgi:hypothetical protein